MPVDLDRLEALARDASPRQPPIVAMTSADIALMAACRPATILALVAVARAARDYLHDRDSCWAGDYMPDAAELRAALAATEPTP